MFFVNIFKFLFKIDAVYPLYRACPVINAAVYSGNNCPCLFPGYCKLFEQAGRPTVVCEQFIIAGGNPTKRQDFRYGHSLIMGQLI